MTAESGFIPLAFAVLTVSDTRTAGTDVAGDILVGRLTDAGHRLAARRIVIDEIVAIRAAVLPWIADEGVDAILTTGGTGITGRDVTPEALEPLFEKRMEGFAVLFHQLSLNTVGAATMHARVTAGVTRGTYIFCLPGSPGACVDAWDNLLKERFDARSKPTNFALLRPRLREQ
ncbi:MAG: molybdenum cofactor biosynthesis protein B [Methylobacteriaceae bacterium]|jgi:molybdenum cofactor biosynthesis protein B|nr:molybdenum cofactor biosynthesis protein B [Methylobacteriaceae bacterium]